MSQQNQASPRWLPPPARDVKTPLAPKPIGGYDVFKGDANRWLADAIQKLEGGIFTSIEDKAILSYVSQVGEYVAKYSAAPTRNYQFIVTTDRSPDAMTAGGGRVYISRGMLELVESEDELAGILAHEIAHDAFHHAAKTVSRQIFWLTRSKKIKTPADAEAALAELNEQLDDDRLAAMGDRLLGFAKFDELEADRAAFYNTYKAGYNPYALATALKRIQCQEDQNSDQDNRLLKLYTLLFGNHPPTAQRTLALKWETNFVKMPSKDSHYGSPAFDAMKERARNLYKD